jgi:hypothetical protein
VSDVLRETLDLDGAHPRLPERQLALLMAAGKRRRVA